MRKLIIKSLIVAGFSLMSQLSAGANGAKNPLGLKVDHITAGVIDIARASAWYQKVLGFELTKQGSANNGAFKFAELRVAGFGISLVQVETTELQRPSAKSQSLPSWIHIVFAVPDPAHVFKVLHQQGVRVWTRDGNAKNHIREFLLSDSEGNEIEIIRADEAGRNPT
jgi:catechol 2,3-dioxygenase-like lactoylglutathione lyase family enzyme